MSFLNSQLLYLLPVVVAVVAISTGLSYLQRKRALQAYGEWRLICGGSNPLSSWRYVLRALFAGLSACCLIVALARPVVPDGTTTIAQGTVDVVAVVDVSRSMAALDYEGKVPPSAVAPRLISDDEPDKPEVAGTRLEMARYLLRDNMLKSLDGNQLGIVSYAGKSFPQAFLTRDTRALDWVIERGLTISSAPGEGSGMGQALELAFAMFDADSPADHDRIIVMFSDGGSDDKASELIELSQECRERGIKLVIVGLGNVMPSPIPVSKLAHDDPVAEALMNHGKKWYEADGQVEKTKLNRSLLQAIANKAGGRFIHLQEPGDLDMLTYVGKKSMTEVPGNRELFPWLLIGALASFAVFIVTTREWRKDARS